VSPSEVPPAAGAERWESIARILPPVSLASGGLLPGISLVTSAVEQIDDLAYVAKMKLGTLSDRG
jgi:hypothetical protein